MLMLPHHIANVNNICYYAYVMPLIDTMLIAVRHGKDANADYLAVNHL